MQWFDIIFGSVLWLVAIGMVVLARRLQKRADALERAAKAAEAPAADDGTRAPAADGALEVLRCLACATPVKLVAAAHTTCPGCGAAVPVPPAYVDLMTQRRYLAEHLPLQAAALRRARIMAHPLVAAALLVAAWLSWHSFGWLMSHLRTGGANGEVVGLFVFFPALYPVGFAVAAFGQLAGGRVLARAVPALAAIKDDQGYACRGCGAALGATEDGVAEACAYCGVQNLIASRVTASDAAAARTARSLGQTLGAASAAFWSRFDRLFVAPLYVAGAVGIILYPFIVLLGFSS